MKIEKIEFVFDIFNGNSHKVPSCSVIPMSQANDLKINSIGNEGKYRVHFNVGYLNMIYEEEE